MGLLLIFNPDRLSCEQTIVIYWIQARLREAASLEKHVLLKKLRDALESLKGCVAGRNKDDVEEAIAMVSVLCFAVLSLIMIYQ